MIGNEQFTTAVEAESTDGEGRIGEELVPRRLRAIVLDSPNAAGGIVTINIRANEFRQLLPVIDDSAGKRTRFVVMMLGRRHCVRMRAECAIGIKDVTSFKDAPAVVVALADEE